MTGYAVLTIYISSNVMSNIDLFLFSFLRKSMITDVSTKILGSSMILSLSLLLKYPIWKSIENLFSSQF